MRLSNLAHLYVVRLRTRLVAELLAVAGIAVGVALVFAALVANASLTGAMQELMRGIVGDATLQVSARGPQGFDQRLLRQVRRIDGVQVAAPVLEVRANLVGPRGRRSVLLVGGEAQLARLGGRLVNGLSATGASSLDALKGQRIVAVPEPIATELGIRLGWPIEVETDTRSVRVPLGVRLHESDVGALVNSPAALAPLDYVQRLSGARGRITRIFVKAGPGREASVADALRELATGRLNVRPADADVEVFEQAAYPTKQSTTLFSALSALVGFLFAFSAVLLTVPHRRNLIADLQMAGYPPTAVLQALLFDAIVLGTVGALVGLGLGDQVSRHMFDDVPDYLSFTFSIGALRTVTWPSVLIAAGAGLAAACLAVLVPLRDVLSHSPLLRPLPPRRYNPTTWMTVSGLACLAAATVIVVAAPALALLGLVALTMALVLVLAPLLRVGTSVFSALTRRAVAPAPPLAALEMRSHASQLRTLAVAATGALALFATVSIAGARADLQRGLDASTRDTVGNADVWITFPDAPNVLATTPFTDAEAIAKDLDDLRDVKAVRVYGPPGMGARPAIPGPRARPPDPAQSGRRRARDRPPTGGRLGRPLRGHRRRRGSGSGRPRDPSHAGAYHVARCCPIHEPGLVTRLHPAERRRLRSRLGHSGRQRPSSRARTRRIPGRRQAQDRAGRRNGRTPPGRDAAGANHAPLPGVTRRPRPSDADLDTRDRRRRTRDGYRDGRDDLATPAHPRPAQGARVLRAHPLARPADRECGPPW